MMGRGLLHSCLNCLTQYSQRTIFISFVCLIVAHLQNRVVAKDCSDIAGLTELYWEGDITKEQFGQWLNELPENCSPSRPAIQPHSIDRLISFYTTMLKRIENTPHLSKPSTLSLSQKLKEELNLVNSQPQWFSDLNRYTTDFHMANLQMELYELEIKALWLKYTSGQLEQQAIEDKLGVCIQYLRQVYMSGLMSGRRKNYVTHTYGLIEGVLRILAQLNTSESTNKLVLQAMEVSRLGELTVNNQFLSQGGAQARLLREVLKTIEKTELELTEVPDFDLHTKSMLRRTINTHRNKYYLIIDSGVKNLVGQEKIPLIREEGVVRITFFEGRDGIYQVVESQEKTDLVVHHKDRLKRLVSELFTKLTQAKNALTGGHEEFKELTAALNSLGAILIVPFKVSRYKQVYILSDGILNDLPFELLLNAENEYLIEKSNVTYGMSEASIHLVDRTVTYSIGQYRQAERRLKHVSRELQSWRGVSGLANNAFEFASSKESNVYHMGNHQLLDLNREPLLLKSDYDTLYRYALYNFKIIPQVMILSSCHSRAGWPVSGEGNKSFTSRSLEIGAQSVIGSLWNVDDKASQQLITSFIKYLKQGIPSDRSLKLAKIDYLAKADDFHKNPFFWSAYVQEGHIFRLKDNSTNRWFYYILVLVSSVAVLLVNLKVKVIIS